MPVSYQLARVPLPECLRKPREGHQQEKMIGDTGNLTSSQAKDASSLQVN